MRRYLIIAGAVAGLGVTTPAAAQTFEGEVTTVWPDKPSLCVTLPEKRSKHVNQMCFGGLGLKWQIGTFGGSPLSSVATKWDLQPTIFLRGDDNAGLGRPIGAFSPEVQEAFKGISLVGIDLAVNVLPNGGAAAVGFGLLPHEGNLGEAGAPYPGNAPSAYSWDSFFVAMPEGDACQYSKDAGGDPEYLAEDVAKTVMKDGFRLANLSVCGASFAGLGSFNTALRKSCEAWASDDKRQSCLDGRKVADASPQDQGDVQLSKVYVPSKPNSPASPTSNGPAEASNLDNLLAEVDAPDAPSDAVPEQTSAAQDVSAGQPKKDLESLLLGIDDPTGSAGQHSQQAAAPKQGLEGLLSGVEGGYAETVKQQQIAAANAAAAAELKRCQSLVAKFDREVGRYESFLDRGSWAGFEPGKEGRCAGITHAMYEYYNANAAYPINAYSSFFRSFEGMKTYAETIDACVRGRRTNFKRLKKTVAKLKLDTCAFEGTTPAEQLTALEKSVERSNRAFLEEADRAMEIHYVWLDAVARADAASAARFNQQIYNSIGNIGSHLQNLNNFDTSAFQDYRTTTKTRTVTTRSGNTASFSYPDVTSGQPTRSGTPSGQTNAPLTMDQGERAGGECASITNAAQQTRCLNEAHGRAMERNRALSAGSGSSGDTTAKTQ